MKFSVPILSGTSRVRSPPTELDSCNKINSENGQGPFESVWELKCQLCEGMSLEMGISDREGYKFIPHINSVHYVTKLAWLAIIVTINDVEMSKFPSFFAFPFLMSVFGRTLVL